MGSVSVDMYIELNLVDGLFDSKKKCLLSVVIMVLEFLLHLYSLRPKKLVIKMDKKRYI